MENSKTYKHLSWLNFVLMKLCWVTIYFDDFSNITHFSHALSNSVWEMPSSGHWEKFNSTDWNGRCWIKPVFFFFFQFSSGFHTEHFKHVCFINIHCVLARNILWSTEHHWLNIKQHDLMRECWEFSLKLSCYATQTRSQSSESLIHNSLCYSWIRLICGTLCQKSLKPLPEDPHKVWETEIRGSLMVPVVWIWKQSGVNMEI